MRSSSMKLHLTCCAVIGLLTSCHRLEEREAITETREISSYAGKQHVDLAWQCALLATTLATLWLPATFGTALGAYSLGYSLLYVVYLGLSYRYSLGVRA